jgi:AcrR family transcriptional regulator
MAIEQFGDRGVDSASLRSIGAALGISHAALRHYFSSRDELLVEVYRAHESRDSDAPSQISADPVASIATAAERNRAIPGLVQLYATLSTDALHEDHALPRDFIADRFGRLRHSLAAGFRDAQASGRTRDDVDADDLAALLIAASDGLQIQWMLAPEDVDVARLLRVLAALAGAADENS